MKFQPYFATALAIFMSLSASQGLLAQGKWQAQALPATLKSSSQVTPVLEVYSSQGCSSCPPAQAWVSQLKDQAGLWQKVVPIVFHVDYWNSLGWQDPYSTASYSARQRRYKALGKINAVYTPGFVVAGQEWRDWFQKRDKAGINNLSDLSVEQKPGVLTAQLKKDGIQIDFAGKSELKPQYVNIARLGFDIKTQVKRGENASRVLPEDFIVLGYARYKFNNNISHIYAWPSSDFKPAREGVAVWISGEDQLTPIQAVGGLIHTHSIIINDFVE